MVFCILKYDSVIGCENVLYGFGDIPDNWVQNIAQEETMKGIADYANRDLLLFGYASPAVVRDIHCQGIGN